MILRALIDFSTWRPTVCVSGGWGEPTNETESAISLNPAFFAGAYPPVRCTLC